jgi:transporter family protein
MSWIPLILVSALLLSAYDIAKKQSVRANAVMPVLFLATACGTAFFVAALAAAGKLPAALVVGRADFWRIVLKSCIVGASWTFAYYALRALPLSIVAPIRASAPFWTLIGAMLVFHEIPTVTQAVGMAAILIGYFVFSLAGEAEGIRFTRNAGVLYVFLGTLLGAVSALYDKYLLQTCAIPRDTLQLWFSIDIAVLLGLGFGVQRLARLERTAFGWRWTIPAVGILLIGADWFYFTALSGPGVAVSILSLIRRSSVVLSFAAGAVFFHEHNFRRKTPALLAILIGVVLLCLK